MNLIAISKPEVTATASVSSTVPPLQYDWRKRYDEYWMAPLIMGVVVLGVLLGAVVAGL